jgi:hypothetical protein
LGLGGGAYFFYLHFGQKAVYLNGNLWVKSRQEQEGKSKSGASALGECPLLFK